MTLPLFALALAAFGIGSAEFLIQGLLPEISADLGVSIPTTGFLVTGYALGVAFGSPFLVVLVNRLTRKTALIALMGLFILGNLLCALAPSYGLLMVARLVTSLCHGSFFGLATVVAANIVPENRRASAVSLVFTGFTVALILGVPAGTALGQAVGWRWTFFVAVALGVVAVAAMVAWLPHEGGSGTRANLKQELMVLTNPWVLTALVLAALSTTGAFTLLTFIAPFAISVTRIDPGMVPLMLLLFGIGGAIGMLVGGRLADWRLLAALIAIVAAQFVMLAVLYVVGGSPVLMMVAIFLWGACGPAIISPIQIIVFNEAKGAPNLASTLVQSAFNIGVSLGSMIGGTALSLGFAYGSLPLVGLIGALIALIVAVVAFGLVRGNAPATPRAIA